MTLQNACMWVDETESFCINIEIQILDDLTLGISVIHTQTRLKMRWQASVQYGLRECPKKLKKSLCPPCMMQLQLIGNSGISISPFTLFSTIFVLHFWNIYLSKIVNRWWGENHTKKTSIKSSIFLCFSNVEVPYLYEIKSGKREITNEQWA